MKIVAKNKKFAIVDNLLPIEQFEKVWRNFQAEQYVTPHQSSWQKVWRLTDSNCMGGPNYVLSKKPFGNYMDGVSSYMMIAIKHVADITGTEGIHWTDASFRPYIYPRGSKLSWHNDGGHYHAALTYYVHPYWGSTWGGELLVAESPDLDSYQHKHKGQPHLDHRWEDSYIAEKGVGQFIFPKPNRLVIMASGVFHSINRIDADAGDNARCSIVSFLLKDQLNKS